MANVGVICGAITGRVFAIINPDDDSELDNPRWLLIKTQFELREPLSLVRVALDEYMTCTDPDQVQAIVQRRLGIEPCQ